MQKMFRALCAVAIAAVLCPSAFAQDWSSSARYRAALESPTPTPMPMRASTGLYLSMFSAGNAVERTYRPYFQGLPRASGDADRAAALAGVRFVELARGESEATASLRREIEQGMSPRELRSLTRLADTVASIALARTQESTGEPPPYLPHTTPGRYVPTAMPLTIGPRQTLRPFVLDGHDAIRPPGPPALDSDRWAEAFQEVRLIGRKEGGTRTPEQTAEAMFWNTPDFGRLVDELLARRDLSLFEQSRIAMLIEMSRSEAAIANADAKNHFQFWRPITAIRRAELDDREDTVPDPSWTPLLITPMHPEYICGHCQAAASFARALAALLPLQPGETITIHNEGLPEDDLARTGVDQRIVADMTVTLTSYDQLVDRMSNSRIYAGVHFRFSNDDAIALGRAAADRVLAEVALPVR